MFLWDCSAQISKCYLQTISLCCIFTIIYSNKVEFEVELAGL